MSALHTAHRRGLLAAIAAAAAAVTLPRIETNPDGELIRLCAAFDVLEHRVQTLGERGVPGWIEDDDARDLAKRPLQEEQRGILDRACALRATTLAGHQARARSLGVWLADQVGDPRHGFWNERMLASLLRDMAGAA